MLSTRALVNSHSNASASMKASRIKIFIDFAFL